VKKGGRANQRHGVSDALSKKKVSEETIGHVANVYKRRGPRDIRGTQGERGVKRRGRLGSVGRARKKGKTIK